MSFKIICADCGRRLINQDDTEDEEATCKHCGSVFEYKIHDNMSVVRLKKYAKLLFPDEIRMFQICCPSCGRKIGSSADGTNTEVTCSKCNAVIRYSIRDNIAYIKVKEPSEKQPAATAQ